MFDHLLRRLPTVARLHDTIGALEGDRARLQDERRRADEEARAQAAALAARAEAAEAELSRRIAAAEAELAGKQEALAELSRYAGGMETASREHAERHRLADERLRAAEAELEELRRELGRVETHRAALAEEAALQARLAQLREEARRQQEALTAQTLALRSLPKQREDRAAAGGAGATLYLDLLEAVLTGTLHGDASIDPWSGGTFDPGRRAIGRDWPATAETMIGTARMRNLRVLLERALFEGVPGDFIETGVWRGGACIYARAILAAHGDPARRVFVADSFRGLPEPDAESFPADAGDTHSTFEQLAVSREQVAENFRRYGLLDERVVFLEGWFKDTLPAAPIERLAVLRLDGDMYESTIEALDALYHKVSPGGFVIVDDYILGPCAQAINDFRARHGITAEMHEVDGAAVWWQVPAA